MKSRLENCFNGLICDSDDALALATVIQVISPTSAKPGDKALISSKGIVEGWIGGACVQNSIVKASEAAINQKQGQLIRVAPKGEFEAIDGLSDFSSGCLSRGSLLIFIEPLKKKTTLSVLGHSPVALKLASLASELDFQVSLISPDLDNKELPEKVVCLPDFTNIEADYCVIATQGRHDKAALKAALNSNACFIGMIASAKKAGALKTKLVEEGLNARDVERIESPLGINIDAQTPVEIALSVLAALVKQRHSNNNRPNSVEGDQQIDGQS